MNIKKAAILLANYKDIDFDYSSVSVSERGGSVEALEIRVGPLLVAGGFEHALAEKVASKHHVALKEYNVNRGTDELPQYKPIFSAICYRENEIPTAMERIKEARRELASRFESLAEFAIKSE